MAFTADNTGTWPLHCHLPLATCHIIQQEKVKKKAGCLPPSNT
ncbi:hypothetical protein DMO16_22350 [Fictibacillus sp. S7]|nr:hypothetical protein DMO16_22350 [Fictibacillus sp. S7]